MNLFEIDVDTTALFRAMDQAVVEIERRCKAVAKDTAGRIVVNARARVARATGETAAGIHAEESYDKTGYVVLPGTGRADAGQLEIRAGFKARMAPGQFRGHHVAQYLEFGTVKMVAQPFFFAAAQIEESGHDRRMRQAISDGIEAAGLGD